MDDNKFNPDDLNVYTLKKILEDLPDDMMVIIPKVDLDDANKIEGFMYVRTVATLEHPNEEAPALCLAASTGGADMYTLIDMMRGDTTVKKLYY